ncbi:MAG: dTMP kinase, partial [Dehalococcoidia bacterium]|nr:dTMP kinase [Dehalococcoidia bacterium]
MPDAPCGFGRPLFIVLEGGEGVGKTTLAGGLGMRLRMAGYPCLLTRDPGGTRLGRSIEGCLKRSASPVPGLTELLMFAAARSLLTSEVILPALKAGKTVISDRYWPSSFAYQGYGRGVDLQTVQEVNRLATGGLRPDLIVYLSLPVEVGLARKA